MKKVIFILSAVLAAQLTMAQVSFGVQGGGILATQRTAATNNTWKPKAMISYKAGGFADIPFATNFSVRPQLNFVSKGGKWNYSDNTDKIEYSERLNYVELPVYVLYKVPVGKNAIIAGIAPVMSIGLGGKGSGTQTISDPFGGKTTKNISYTVKFDGKENADDDYSHYKGFEMGLGFIAGYQLSNGLLLQVGYNLGLSNIETSKNSSLKNSYFGFGVGYQFGK